MANSSRGRKNKPKNELNKNIDCSITKSILVKKILGGLRWFVVVCLHRLWFHCLFPNSGDDLWWFAVMCGGFGFFPGGLR